METESELAFLPASIAVVDPELATNESAVLEFVQQVMANINGILGKYGSIVPTFFIMGYQEKECVVFIISPPPFRSEADKDFATAAVKAMAEQLSAFGVLSISESWSLELKGAKTKEDAEKMLQGLSIADQPDKKEVITVIFEHRLVGSKMWQAPIVRDVDDKPTVVKFEEVSDQMISGRFLGMLPTPKNATLN